jgi:hypothetical protein
MDRWPAAIGVIPGTDGAWVGVERDNDGFRLVYGEPATNDLRPSSSGHAERREELKAVAAAYFEERLDDPPQELEAMQADLADVVRWLASAEPDAARQVSLNRAVDAIDDGLPGDVIVSHLNEARAGSPERHEQVDAVDLLVRRYRALSAPGS